MSTAPQATSSGRLDSQELALLAAQLAVQSSHAIDQSPLSAAAVARYCTASRERYRAWIRLLRLPHGAQSSVRPWIEEILISEVLTRVWAAMVYALASRREENWGAASVAVHVSRLHAAARHRALRLVASGVAGDHQDAAELDQLRRSMARWIDLLVAHVMHDASLQGSSLSDGIDVCEFAVDPQRAREFVDDLRHQAADVRHASLALTTASLRDTLDRQRQDTSPNGHLNFDIATSILSCVHSDEISSAECLQDVWAVRLLHRAADAERWLEQLLM